MINENATVHGNENVEPGDETRKVNINRDEFCRRRY
jgi:hypothetical protein